jgi:hypothetical protein
VQKHKGRLAILFAAWAVLLLGATSPTFEPQKWLDRYLEVRRKGDLAEQKKLIAPGARIWYVEKIGEGFAIDLDDDGSQWDRAMNTTLTYSKPIVSGDSITADFIEKNDFYRLIGIGEWKARITFRFDLQGRILEELYVPDKTQPPSKQYVKPFVTWAEKNQPAVLEKIYPGRIVRNAESAKLWKQALTDWRKATGQPLTP